MDGCTRHWDLMAQRQTRTKDRNLLAITHTSCVTRATGRQETGAGRCEHSDWSATEPRSDSDILGERAFFGPAKLAGLWLRPSAAKKRRADCVNYCAFSRRRANAGRLKLVFGRDGGQ